MEGRQRIYLMLAMEMLVKEDWPTVFSFSFVSFFSPLVSLLPVHPVLLLFSFAFVCSGRDGATRDEDDGN
jgi:hypothetical protein